MSWNPTAPAKKITNRRNVEGATRPWVKIEDLAGGAG